MICIIWMRNLEDVQVGMLYLLQLQDIHFVETGIEKYFKCVMRS